MIYWSFQKKIDFFIIVLIKNIIQLIFHKHKNTDKKNTYIFIILSITKTFLSSYILIKYVINISKKSISLTL